LVAGSAAIWGSNQHSIWMAGGKFVLIRSFPVIIGNEGADHLDHHTVCRCGEEISKGKLG